MPAVIVFSRPNGLPIATTHSPTLSFSGSPIVTFGRSFASILMQRDVGALVDADHLRLELALVGELDVDLVGAVDDVRVGDDVAVARDDEAGADRLLLEIALRRPAPRDLPAEAAEEFVERIVLRQLGEALPLDLLRDVDADDGGALLFVELREIRQRSRAALRRCGSGRRGKDGERRVEHRGSVECSDCETSSDFGASIEAVSMRNEGESAMRNRIGDLAHGRAGRLAEHGDEVVVELPHCRR